ncbi:outer membrane lipoprotein chaperone LolA [Agaribacter marinus]|uniref:Outer-membrane lipoprotein carrier protein n=1 Tax=Agaribacter marinus TaxID=1431249 RepID=A0AA37WJA1_9ALTE|nr:outer membrane lipoprotein chaperone LolA [Agaribacter marinus]GLR69979.1 outer-membrane lipoprotein carrier protein [Agaribacter marinus]
MNKHSQHIYLLDKRIGTGVFFTSMLLMLLAASFNAMANKDASEALRLKLNNINSYQAAFSQTIKDAQNEILLESEGQIVIGKPNKLRWEVSAPDESLLVADGDTVYNIDPFVEQVTLLSQSQVIQNNPLSLLISDDEEVWGNVAVSRKDDIFTVESQDENASISSVILTFDGERLISLSSIDAQEQTNKIAFSQIKQNPMLTLNLFSVNIPESFEVDDQR